MCQSTEQASVCLIDVFGFMEYREMIIFLFFRAQDQASMQLSEMEEEMDQRIHAAERKTREQVGHTQTK